MAGRAAGSSIHPHPPRRAVAGALGRGLLEPAAHPPCLLFFALEETHRERRLTWNFSPLQSARRCFATAASADMNSDPDDIDFIPVVKLFTLDGGRIWLLTELEPEHLDSAFGLRRSRHVPSSAASAPPSSNPWAAGPGLLPSCIFTAWN